MDKDHYQSCMKMSENEILEFNHNVKSNRLPVHY